MELIAQILKQLPPFWPRLVAVIVLVLLLLLPQTRRLFKRVATGDRRLDRARHLLEVRKLQIEIDALRAKNPEIADSALDSQIQVILSDPEEDEEAEAPPLLWWDRAKLAAVGSFAVMMVGFMGLWLTGRRTGPELGQLALKELLVIVPCALLASAIPAGARWSPVFYGVVIPVLVVALSVAARAGA